MCDTLSEDNNNICRWYDWNRRYTLFVPTFIRTHKLDHTSPRGTKAEEAFIFFCTDRVGSDVGSSNISRVESGQLSRLDLT